MKLSIAFTGSILWLLATTEAGKAKRTETYSSYIYRVLKMTPPVYTDLDGDGDDDMVYGFVDSNGCGGAHVFLSSYQDERQLFLLEKPTIEIYRILQAGECDPNFGMSVSLAVNDDGIDIVGTNDDLELVNRYPWQFALVSGDSLKNLALSSDSIASMDINADPGDVVWGIVDDDVSGGSAPPACDPCCGPDPCCIAPSRATGGTGSTFSVWRGSDP